MPALQLPFAHLNLLRNPFGEYTRAERLERSQPSFDLSTIAAQLKQNKFAVQFLGDHGRGKSTHLIALHAYFAQSDYLQFHEQETPILQQVISDIAFFDSFDVLSKKQRKKIYQQVRSFACTTHTQLDTELRRAGFTIHNIHISQTDSLQIHRILNTRIESVRRNTAAIPHIPLSSIHTLQSRFKDDIRSMELYLYDVFSQLQETVDVTITA